MLTYEQAVRFLEGILGMPPTWRELLYNKPLEFLRLYMKRFAVRIPFQNIHMAAIEPGKRWFPSESDIVTAILSGDGGCCIYLNYFTKLVFQAIGLNSFVVRGDHYCAPIAGTHCIAMVKFEGPHVFGIFMVEVGGGYPILDPIPMQGLPYRTLQAGGFAYEFREIAPGWIGKFHINGGLMGGAFTDKKEILRTSWDLKPRGFWEYDYPMLETFTKPCYSALLKNPMMYRFFTNKEFRKLFPELPENMIENAKGKALITNRQALSNLGKTLAANGKVTLGKTTSNAKPTVPTPKISETNAKNTKVTNGASSISNGKPIISATNGRSASSALNGKSTPGGKAGEKAKVTESKSSSASTPTPIKTDIIAEISEEYDDDYEVVTEESAESDEDVDEDPKNFIFAWKQRIVIGDANSRKIVKNYKSYEEMGNDLKRYFPKIPSDKMDKALTVFKEFEPIFTPYDAIL